jgi:hypothetical protein
VSEDNTQAMTLEAKVDQILLRLTALEAKTYDTRPIWERALAEILDIKDRMISLEDRFDRQEDKVDIFVKEVLEMKRKLRSTV